MLCLTTDILEEKRWKFRLKAKKNLRWSPNQKSATLILVPTVNVLAKAKVRRSTAPPEKAALMSWFSYLNLIRPLVVFNVAGRWIIVEWIDAAILE